MIELPAGVHVWLAAGETDLRKGVDGLTALIQLQLSEDPFSGQLYVFRGRRGDRVKILWWDGDGLCSFAKRLERGKFVWPRATSGTVSLTGAQLSMLLEGIDWRRPSRTFGADRYSAYRSGYILAERIERELQREVSRRVSEHGVVYEPDGCEDPHRELAASLQRGSTALEPWQSDAIRV